MTPRRLAQRARAALREAADPRIARSQKKFFKPGEKISLYGLKTPDVKRIERELYAGVRKSWAFSEARVFCDLLMRDRHLESKAVGLLLLERYRSQFEEDLLGAARGWLEEGLCDNWAVTDDLSTGVLWRLLERFENVAGQVEKWRQSPNLWVRRAGVVMFVNDLIHKACGWLLREAGKADVRRLEGYLLKHGPAISRTTLRYAIEKFPEGKRRRILEDTRGEA